MNQNENYKKSANDANELYSTYNDFRRTHGDIGDVDDLIFGSQVETKTHSER